MPGTASLRPRMTVVLLFGILACLALSGLAMAAPEPAGYVDALTGAVTAVHPDLGRRALALEDKVYAGDVIATAAGAAARIVFRDKSMLEIKASSRVDLADFAFGSGRDKHMAVKFAVGVFRMVTGEIVKANPAGFRVESPLSVIGIRGTDFASRIQAGSELHALFSTGTPIDVQADGREQRIDRPEYGVEVTPTVLGAPRPLTAEEKRLFARLAFTRQMDSTRLRLLLQSTRPVPMRIRP